MKRMNEDAILCEIGSDGVLIRIALLFHRVSAYFYMSDTVLLPTAQSRLPSTIVRVPS
jgi:hypothetical protein